MDYLKLPDCLQPRLRAFLSIDLIGSTALKQKGQNLASQTFLDEQTGKDRQGWLSVFGEFYSLIQMRFFETWQSFSENEAKKWTLGPKPYLWKCNGDELIFAKDLVSQIDLAAVIICWLRTAKKYQNHIESLNYGLDVKLCCWVAGFPIMNSEVILAGNQPDALIHSETGDIRFASLELLNKWYKSKKFRSSVTRDFIGPSIDTGFRLGAKSTSKKFIISLETAYVLAHTSLPPELTLDIRYDGRESLKGVMGGIPYPLFWINAEKEDALSKAEDQLSQVGTTASEGQIREFCRAFIKKHDDYLFLPFIAKNTGDDLKEIPDAYNNVLVGIWKRWTQISAEIARDKKSATANPKGKSLSKADIRKFGQTKSKGPDH